LVVQRQTDVFGAVVLLLKTAQANQKNTTVRLVIIPGAGHFFEGGLDELKHAITEWAADHYP
jgi:alpha/beta superfamily hydrolase